MTAPRAPSAAERVRSICARATDAQVAVAGVDPVVLAAHHLHGGRVVCVLAADTPVHDQARRAGSAGSPAVLELTDTAVVAVREPVRALVWLQGRLHPVHDQAALAITVAEAHPHPALLDVGHGATLLTLELDSVVVADGTGAEPVEPATLLAATPDPFAACEAEWVRHLDDTHADLLALMARRLPPELRRGRLRPLGIDRFGVELRVERTGPPDVTVRLSFPTPVTDAAGLGRGLRALAGCPFLNGLHARS